MRAIKESNDLLVPGLVELDVAEDGAGHEEDQHGVQENEACLSHQHVVCVGRVRDRVRLLFSSWQNSGYVKTMSRSNRLAKSNKECRKGTSNDGKSSFTHR